MLFPTQSLNKTGINHKGALLPTEQLTRHSLLFFSFTA